MAKESEIQNIQDATKQDWIIISCACQMFSLKASTAISAEYIDTIYWDDGVKEQNIVKS